MASKTPTVKLRHLAAELLRLRTEKNLTREQVADLSELDKVTIYRAETGKRPQRRTVTALLKVYGVSSKDDQAPYLDLLKQSDSVDWFMQFKDSIPESYASYISFESEASQIRDYESALMPGLLQTEDYVRAIFAGVIPETAQSEVDKRVAVRMHRQELVTQSAVSIWAILDEAVIRRVVGGPKVHRAQLHHLIEASRRPNVTLQVVPYAAGAHFGMPGAFTVLSFTGGHRPLVYTENAGGGLFLETDAAVTRYQDGFQRVAAQALNFDDSLQLIEEVAQAT